MKNFMRKFLAGWTIFFLALIPFARAYNGIPWTVFAAIISGMILIIFWKRFPEYERRQKLQEAASKKALAEITAEIGKQAMMRKFWGPMILVSVIGTVVMFLAAVFLFGLAFYAAFAVAFIFMVAGNIWLSYTPLAKRISRRVKELFKASL